MSILSRFSLAFRTFFLIIKRGSLPADAAPCAEATPKLESAVSQADSRSAVQLLGALQREGRLVDFLMDEVEGASDADVGIAARVIHRGCRQVIDSYFDLVPAYPGVEGVTLTVESGYDPNIVDIVGGAGDPPFTGTLNHQGWRIRETRMPSLTSAFSASLIQRAEIER
jgi:hypothetical protein